MAYSESAPNSGKLTRTGVEKKSLAELAGQNGSGGGSNCEAQLPSLMNQSGKSSSASDQTYRSLKDLMNQ